MDGARTGATPEARWLDLPVLNHAHGHPVARVHVLPDEVLEHDECLHQEVLQKCQAHPSPHITGTDCTCLHPSGCLNAFLLSLKDQIGEGSGFG